MPSVRSRSVRVGRHRLHYLEAGHGPDLLLLPSMLVMARSYGPLIRLLGRHFRVVAPELPGSGLSSRVSQPLSLDASATIALQVVDALGLRRATWVGHSNSGPVAVLAALRAPEQVRVLVLADTIGGYPDDTVPRVIARRAWDAILEPRLSTRGAPHVAWNFVWHHRNFRAQVRAAATVRIERSLSAVEVPVLLAWGRRDFTEPPGCARRLRRASPRAHLVFGQGRHDWLILGRRPFTRMLVQFVRPRPETTGSGTRGVRRRWRSRR